MRKTPVMILSALIASVGMLAVADGHASDEQLNAAVNARKAQMQLYAFNIGILGGMAQEKIAYDADAASAAAGNLAALAATNQMAYWPAGSDNVSLETTRAKPEIWQAGSQIGAEIGKFSEATAVMAVEAGKGLDALRGAIGAVGGSCGSCHKAYRGPER